MDTPIQERVDQVCEYLKTSGHEAGRNYRMASRIERQYRRNQMGEGAVLPIYVVAVEISRNYGGPEEGGWYYDCSYVAEVRRVWDWQAARAAIRALREEYPINKYGRGSVLGGVDTEIRLTTDVEEIELWENTERPSYE